MEHENLLVVGADFSKMRRQLGNPTTFPFRRRADHIRRVVIRLCATSWRMTPFYQVVSKAACQLTAQRGHFGEMQAD